MYKGKHTAPRRRRRSNKSLALLISLVMIAAVAVGGTLAWLTTATAPVQNTMEPGRVPITIDEKVSGTTKTDVKIKNTGNVDAYIRVAVIANAVDEDGNIVVGSTPPFTVSSNWEEIDGYYYYKGIVPVGGSTTSLFADDVNFANGEVNILAESIQVQGGYNGRKPETYAWGRTYTNGSWS